MHSLGLFRASLTDSDTQFQLEYCYSLLHIFSYTYSSRRRVPISISPSRTDTPIHSFIHTHPISRQLRATQLPTHLLRSLINKQYSPSIIKCHVYQWNKRTIISEGCVNFLFILAFCLTREPFLGSQNTRYLCV